VDWGMLPGACEGGASAGYWAGAGVVDFSMAGLLRPSRSFVARMSASKLAPAHQDFVMLKTLIPSSILTSSLSPLSFSSKLIFLPQLLLLS
jgi:hypothetical protein